MTRHKLVLNAALGLVAAATSAGLGLYAFNQWRASHLAQQRSSNASQDGGDASWNDAGSRESRST